MIFAASASQVLADTLGEVLEGPVVPLSYHTFPDGELLVSVDTEAALPAGADLTRTGFTVDGRAIIVASTASASAHIELLQLQELARAAGASPIVTVIPYFGYMRQEVAHEPGQPASARAVARAVSATTDRVVTVDPHEAVVAEYFTVPCEIVSAVDTLESALSIETPEPLFLAPDEGARSLAAALREAHGRGAVDHFIKDRHGPESVEITPRETDVTGREVVIVDDIVATGSTIAQAATVLVDRGACSVRVGCVHAVLVGNAYTRLRRAGVDEFVATDTIEGAATETSAAPAIARVL